MEKVLQITKRGEYFFVATHKDIYMTYQRPEFKVGDKIETKFDQRALTYVSLYKLKKVA